MRRAGHKARSVPDVDGLPDMEPAKGTVGSIDVVDSGFGTRRSCLGVRCFSVRVGGSSVGDPVHPTHSLVDSDGSTGPTGSRRPQRCCPALAVYSAVGTAHHTVATLGRSAARHGARVDAALVGGVAVGQAVVHEELLAGTPHALRASGAPLERPSVQPAQVATYRRKPQPDAKRDMVDGFGAAWRAGGNEVDSGTDAGRQSTHAAADAASRTAQSGNPRRSRPSPGLPAMPAASDDACKGRCRRGRAVRRP